MEAALSDSEEEDLEMVEVDDELVKLLQSLVDRALEIQNNSKLPEDLYVIPDIAGLAEHDHTKRGELEISDQEEKVGACPSGEENQKTPIGWQDYYGKSSREEKES
jgi:hypothetical protein